MSEPKRWYKPKLIEVAIPLEEINKESAREKSIRHGHPSTLHLWWARRPLAACRAVLFAQLVDDPSAHPDRFRLRTPRRPSASDCMTSSSRSWSGLPASRQRFAARTGSRLSSASASATHASIHSRIASPHSDRARLMSFSLARRRSWP
ncbi:MAG: DUF1156 domain-containing protein [Streptosporangiaceae bacterium]